MRKLIPSFMLLLFIILAPGVGYAQTQGLSDGSLEIGVLADMSGIYKAMGGPGEVLAVKMAINDFGGTVLGKPIKLISADHQGKPSLASSIARQWIDDKHVDMLLGFNSSSAALAVQGLASSKNKITFEVSSGATALTEDQCTKYGIHYTYSTYALPVGTATAIVKGGGKSWFFITADYAFGHSLEENTSRVVKDLGGKVLGSVKAPLGTNDFSSYLLEAKASGADVIALANAGTDTVNAIKQAHKFGILKGGQQLAGMLIFLTDLKALGLETAQGLKFTTAFYWGRTAESREWSQRFFKKHGAMPTMVQAGAYSAALTYLKAVKKAGTDDADAVRKVLGDMTINDMFVKDGHIQPNGLMSHDMYLAEVKSPDESKGPWDLEKILTTIPAKDAWIPLSKSSCPLLSH